MSSIPSKGYGFYDVAKSTIMGPASVNFCTLVDRPGSLYGSKPLFSLR
jgi:hypothetical protein